MEEKNNNKTQEPAGTKKEMHYHYHMGERGYPQGPVSSGGKPGELHYHYYYEPPRIKKGRSSKPTIAGVLLLLHAVFSILVAVAFFGSGMFVGDLGSGFEFMGSEGDGDIIGTITLLDGTPVENATITIVDTQLITQSDDQGNYLLYNVPSGNQKIRVEKQGYSIMVFKAFISPTPADTNIEAKDYNNRFDFTLTEGNEVIEKGSYPPWELIRNILIVCAVVIIVLSVFVLIGAYAAFKRQNYGLAIGGAVAGVITLGILPIIALFILVLAKDEFKKPQMDTPPSVGPVGGETP
jgi:hypothetical protein